MAELAILYWRDIPAQVIAREGDASARRQLPARFQQAIDAAAMREGLHSMDDYLSGWRRETRDCAENIEREVATEAARIESTYSNDTLRRLVRAGGREEHGARRVSGERSPGLSSGPR